MPDKPKHAGGKPRGTPDRCPRTIAAKQLKAKSNAVAFSISKDGDVLPLAVLVEAMRHHYYKFKADEKANFKDMATAASYAKEAAPYFHPKLASTEIKGDPTKPLTPPSFNLFFGDPDEQLKHSTGIPAFVPTKKT